MRKDSRGLRILHPNLRLLGAKGVYRPSLIFTMAGSFILLAMAFELGYAKIEPGFFLLRSSIGSVIMIAFLMAWGWLSDRIFKSTSVRAWLNVFAAFASGLVRSFSLAAIPFTALSSATTGNSLSRALLAASMNVMFFVSVGLAQSLRRSFVREEAKRQAAVHAAMVFRESMDERIAHEESKLRESVSKVLLPILYNISSFAGEAKSSDDLKMVVQNISEALRFKLKPLSQSIGQLEPVAATQSLKTQPEIVSITKLPKETRPVELVSGPMQLAVLGTLLVTMGMFRNTNPWLMVLFAILNLASVWGSQLFIRRVVPNYKMSVPVGFFFLLALNVLSFMVPAITVSFEDLTFKPNLGILISVAVAIGISTFLIAFVGLLDYNTTAKRQGRRRAEAALARSVDIFNQHAWVARRSWRYLVHGDVQSAFTLASNRFADSQNPTFEEMQVATEDLTRALRALERGPQPATGIREAMKSQRDTWAGVCDVTFEITEGDLAKIADNKDLSFAFNEIFKELIGNASRHAGANEISISIKQNDLGGFDLIADNTGIWKAESTSTARLGLGSAMFTELTSTWTRGPRIGGQGTRVSMEIPA